METTQSRYDALVSRVELLNEGVEGLALKAKQKTAELKRFIVFLDGLHIANPFPVLETELNTLIGGWKANAPLSQLQGLIAGHYDKIKKTDQGVSELKQRYQALQNSPDRHNCRAVVGKIELFFKNIPNIKLEQLDTINNQVIPGAHAMIDGVMKGFDAEEEKVKKNISEARRLKKRIDGCSHFVARFDLPQLCTAAGRLADRVILSPNRANPDDDASQLQAAHLRFDQCIAQYDAEEKRYKQLLQTIEDNDGELWYEDYDALVTILLRGARRDATPADELQEKYQSLTKVKERDLDQAFRPYSNKVRARFSSKIDELYNTCSRHHELTNLLVLLDEAAAEERKKQIILTLKIVGVVLAVVAVAVATIVWGWWVLIVLAIIVGAVCYVMYENGYF